MYFPATKIKVLASTVNKAGAALRKGSLGYVGTVGDVYTPHKPANSLSITYAMLPGRLVVTRFGNEAKRRAEVKPVIYVIPINGGVLNGKQFKNINTLLEDAKRFTGQFASLWDKSSESAKRLPFIVATPTTEEAVVTASREELCAWVYSLFSTSLLRNALAKNDIGHGHGAVLAKALSKYLPKSKDTPWYKFFMYKQEIAKLLDSLSEEQLNNFVIFLQGQRSIYIRDYLKETYAVGETSKTMQLRMQIATGINPERVDIPGLHNLKYNRIAYKQIGLAWLHACYQLNSHKGGIAYTPGVYPMICDWLKRITTSK